MIRRRWLSRATATAAAGVGLFAAALVGGAPGWASAATGNANVNAGNANLNAGNANLYAGDANLNTNQNAMIQVGTVPITAAAFSAKATAVTACQPLGAEDVWYFGPPQRTSESAAPMPEPSTGAPEPGTSEPAPASGEPKPGEPKSGESKPGESKSGESKPGESKPGESKSGEPDGGARRSAFVSVTLTFAAADALGPRVATIGPDGIDGTGTASIRTQAGWTLIGATAEVAGGVQPGPTATIDPQPRPAAMGARSYPWHFALAATCPAGIAGQLFVPVPPPAIKSTPRVALRTPRPVAASGPGAVTTRTATPVAVVVANASSGLPTTGQDIGGMLTLGVTLVVAGVLLLIVRRQRAKPATRPEPSDWY